MLTVKIMNSKRFQMLILFIRTSVVHLNGVVYEVRMLPFGELKQTYVNKPTFLDTVHCKHTVTAHLFIDFFENLVYTVCFKYEFFLVFEYVWCK